MRSNVKLGMLVAVFLASGAWGLTAIAGTPGRADSPEATKTAADAVTAALRAEAEGKLSQRKSSLEQARAAAPKFAPAHWQSGELLLQGKWRTIAEYQHQAAQNSKLKEYEARRNALYEQPTLEGELELAQWCLKHKLDVAARAHWFHVLSYEPDHPQALKHLGLVQFQGQLLTHDELTEKKKAAGRELKAVDTWKKRLAVWRHDLSSTDEPRRAEALANIRAITDPDVVFPFEQVLLSKEPLNSQRPDFSLAMISALSAMREPQVTEALVRQAALSKWPQARAAAVEELKKRKLLEYIPYVMSNLKLPLVRTFRFEQWPDGIVYYEQVLTREGAIVDEERTERKVIKPVERIAPLLPGRSARTAQSPVHAANAQIRDNEAALLRGQSLAQQDSERVEQANRESETLNSALSGLLKEVTGEDDCSTPQQWWNWWKQFNEVTFPYAEDKRVRRSETISITAVRTTCSCFVAGTPVITLTGPRPVETIRPGDLVLSQDPRSGELTFQAVLETSIREAAAQRKITFGGNSITATLGHRFWVDGRGWQMTKDLQPGDRLHTPSGAVAIDSIDEADQAPAYGLTVDGFRTYFVGDDQVLVHDKTAPRTVFCVVPGLAADDPPAAGAAAQQPAK